MRYKGAIYKGVIHPLLAAVAGVSLAWALGVFAAGPAPCALPARPVSREVPLRGPVPRYSNRTLARFVFAYEHVQAIVHKYAGKLTRARGDLETKRIIADETGEIRQAIASHGLALRTFIEIAEGTKHDPELKERVLDLLLQAEVLI